MEFTRLSEHYSLPPPDELGKALFVLYRALWEVPNSGRHQLVDVVGEAFPEVRYQFVQTMANDEEAFARCRAAGFLSWIALDDGDERSVDLWCQLLSDEEEQVRQAAITALDLAETNAPSPHDHLIAQVRQFVDAAQRPPAS